MGVLVLTVPRGGNGEAATVVVVVLAMEERDRKAHVTAGALTSRYGSSFMHMLYSIHTVTEGMPGLVR